MSNNNVPQVVNAWSIGSTHDFRFGTDDHHVTRMGERLAYARSPGQAAEAARRLNAGEFVSNVQGYMFARVGEVKDVCHRDNEDDLLRDVAQQVVDGIKWGDLPAELVLTFWFDPECDIPLGVQRMPIVGECELGQPIVDRNGERLTNGDWSFDYAPHSERPGFYVTCEVWE